ncbi:MAG: acyl-CoA desaturase [Flavipsychrobacter sp.]|nr:acyl-CoA desaturase [Flavipsychrobacter sp.]
MPVIIFFIAVWYLSLFSQTFFNHRYASHAAFRMSKGWERFFFIFGYITQGAHYMSPHTYAIMHRLHHAHTDTEDDPHSPGFSRNFIMMMWSTQKVFTDIRVGNRVVDEKYMKNLPEWKGFDKWASSNLSRLLWVGAYITFFVFFATSPWQWLLLPVIITMGMVHGTIINWFAHKVGYANFVVKNTSKNLWLIDILMLGEAYHNNHHKHPSSINFAYKRREIDPVYPVILLLDKLKVITINRQIQPQG